MELPAVAVVGATGPAEHVAQPFPPFLDLPSATLENAHPGHRRGTAEERQVHTEAVVGVILRAGVGDEFGETNPAGLGQHVDATTTTHLGAVGTRVFIDQPVGLHPAQRRVERPVRERTERAQQPGEPLAQLVAVHRRFEEESEDCQFEHNPSFH